MGFRKRILVAPLDWGLGHAARCIPIIHYLLERKCEVVVAADGRPMELLRKEVPQCQFLSMGGYGISYPKSGSMALKMASQVPKILSGIKKEQGALKKIIREKKIDAVISDNRFGLWSDEIPCVFITHQVMVKSPFGENLIHQLNKKYISKYSECWVPDVAEDGLSGDLSHKFPLPANTKYIGVLSRFKSPVASHMHSQRKLLVILSGPEPQRTIFEQTILAKFSPLSCFRNNRAGGEGYDRRSAGGEVLIVQGITEENKRMRISDQVEVVSHLASDELESEILHSEIILSRPGYSTIMDLAVLGKKAIFVPTPGQTEQEYLGKYFAERKIAYSVPQKKFDLETALKEAENYSGFTGKYPGEEFKRAVDGFLEIASVASGQAPSQ